MPRPSLSVAILVALALGVFTGLFVGEPAAGFQPIADIYIRLMQMTVLPYLVLSLVIGFGQLDAAWARRLAWRAGALVAITWALTVAVLVLLPFTFPAVESASFYSSALVDAAPAFSIPDLYFTANPFNALANAVVPAVVLFSAAVGIALIGLPGRERVLDVLRVLNAAITAVTLFVVRLTPVGVFAIAAVTAGTLTTDTLVRLEAYFVVFTAASLLLAFWLLPLLVTAVTPFRYGEVAGAARDALLTAFVANNAFIVLPIIGERAKQLLAARGLHNQDGDTAADVLVPILFNFPNAGRLLTLLFVPFAAWLAGAPLTPGDYPRLMALGIPSYFAKAQVALPYLLDALRLPHDLFQLYVPTTIVTGKFDSMVTAMNLLVFALLGAAAMGGFLSLSVRRLARAGAAMAAGTAVTFVAVWGVLAWAVQVPYDRDEALRRMHAPQDVPAGVVRDAATLTPDPPPAAGSSVVHVRARGRLRVGYDPHNPPFSFTNGAGELVGLDVELSQKLAVALGTTAEFIPVPWDTVGSALQSGLIDLMPSVWYRPYWFSAVRLSAPYVTGTMALIVADSRRGEFARIDDLRRSRGLRVGVPLDRTQVASSLDRYFGGAAVEFVPLPSSVDFLEERAAGLDAFLMPAESGAAATLLHPRFSVVVPQPDPVRVPFAFAAAPGAGDLVDAVNEWVIFATSEGTIDRAYRYWVLGEGARPPGRRWSIMRDVLKWVE